MLIYFLFYISFIIPKTIQKDCQYIVPNGPEECILSESDKQAFKYCCFVKEYGNNRCRPYIEEKYLADKKRYEESNPPITFVCNDESVTPSLRKLASKDCEDVSPSKQSDWVMSQKDKDDGYDYCCYERIGTLKVCTLDTKKSYEEELEFIKYIDDVEYECTDKVGKSFFLSLSFIFLILNTLII